MYQAKALLWTRIKYLVPGTGKSFSEALILGPTNPQYEKRFFIELRFQFIT